MPKLHNLKSSRHSNGLGYTMHPRVTSFSNFNLHGSSWREQTDATNAMGKNTLSGQILLSKIQPKQLMLVGGEERKN